MHQEDLLLHSILGKKLTFQVDALDAYMLVAILQVGLTHDQIDEQTRERTTILAQQIIDHIGQETHPHLSVMANRGWTRKHSKTVEGADHDS